MATNYTLGAPGKLPQPKYAEWGQPGQQDPNDPRAQQDLARQGQLTVQAPGLQGQQDVQAPGLQAASTTNAAPATPDPFTAMGGGTNVNGNWIPNSNPAEIARQQALLNPAGAAPTATGGGGPAAQPTTQTGVLGAPGATVGGQTPQGQPATIASAFQQALLNRLAPQDITSANPAIAGSIAANRGAEQRGLAKTREMLAERAASTGQTGAQETGLRQAIGESTGRQGAYEGNALFGLHQQQQNDLTDALGLSGNLLDSQQRQEAARYGLDLDAALRREQLAASTGLGNRELDIRDRLGGGQLGLGYAGLQQGGQQFNQQLGANLGLGQAQLNQNALLQLLQGL